MAKLEGIKAVQVALRKAYDAKMGDSGKPPRVIVGYTASYALYVHENLQARHAGYTFVSYKSGVRRNYIGVGQAKFLEQPAREMKDELAALVVNTVKKGGTLLQGLLIAGMALQRASMLLCPIDTSALRNSAFTEDGTFQGD